MRRLVITKVQYKVNMRLTRAYRDQKICRDLKEGFCILALNTAENIMRLWDCYGSYTMYAPPGEVFDTATIELWLRRGIGVRLPNLYDMDDRVAETAKPEEIPAVPARKVRLAPRRRKAA